MEKKIPELEYIFVYEDPLFFISLFFYEIQLNIFIYRYIHALYIF